MEQLDWIDALAAIDEAFAATEGMSGDNPLGSPEEERFKAACSRVAAAINTLIETPAPHLEGVRQKLEFLGSDLGGAEPEEIAHVIEDIDRIAGIDQGIRDAGDDGVDGVISLMEGLAGGLEADWDETSFFWIGCIQTLAESVVKLRDKAPVSELSALVGAAGVMIAHLRRKQGAADVSAAIRARGGRTAIH
jgi:hypothetical protein